MHPVIRIRVAPNAPNRPRHTVDVEGEACVSRVVPNMELSRRDLLGILI